MRIPRIYYLGKLNPSLLIELTAESSHYVIHVLRLKLGGELLLFNGDGSEYVGHIEKIQKKNVVVRITSVEAKNNESPLHIHLLQGISKGDHMDFTLQKAVELGVNRITPIMTEFCQVKLDKTRSLRKYAHWQSIIINACQQSGRTILPHLDDIQTYSECLKKSDTPLKLICHPGQPSQQIKELQKPSAVAILIGPEGGFSETEVAQAEKKQFVVVSLGPRILRTETAALAIISVVQGFWGDLAV